MLTHHLCPMLPTVLAILPHQSDVYVDTPLMPYGPCPFAASKCYVYVDTPLMPFGPCPFAASKCYAYVDRHATYALWSLPFCCIVKRLRWRSLTGRILHVNLKTGSAHNTPSALPSPFLGLQCQWCLGLTRTVYILYTAYMTVNLMKSSAKNTVYAPYMSGQP